MGYVSIMVELEEGERMIMGTRLPDIETETAEVVGANWGRETKRTDVQSNRSDVIDEAIAALNTHYSAMRAGLEAIR